MFTEWAKPCNKATHADKKWFKQSVLVSEHNNKAHAIVRLLTNRNTMRHVTLPTFLPFVQVE